MVSHASKRRAARLPILSHTLTLGVRCSGSVHSGAPVPRREAWQAVGCDTFQKKRPQHRSRALVPALDQRRAVHALGGWELVEAGNARPGIQRPDPSLSRTASLFRPHHRVHRGGVVPLPERLLAPGPGLSTAVCGLGLHWAPAQAFRSARGRGAEALVRVGLEQAP